jgi:hypothetical protein
MKPNERYSIDDVTKLTGVSRRHVRHLVQRGLIPKPLGRGPGPNYGPEHIEAIRRAEDAKKRGERITPFVPDDRETIVRAAGAPCAAGARVSVTRICLSSAGVWLEVADAIATPGSEKLERLVALCRQELALPIDGNAAVPRYAVVSRCGTPLVLPDAGESGAALKLQPGERLEIDEPNEALRKAEARGLITIEPA